MNLRRFAWFVAAVSATVLDSELRAADARVVKPPDPDLPQPLDPNVAAPLLESSPFTRAINLSESLALTGVAYVQGKPVATLTDTRNKKSYLVSEVPNEHGWKLAGVTPAAELRFTTVKIMVGPEIVVIRYSNTQLAPAAQVRYPTDSEAIRHDENGKPYVRGSAYLSDADRDRYYNGISREAHDKFREVIRDNREMMFKASPEERAAFAKKVLDKVEADDRSRQRR